MLNFQSAGFSTEILLLVGKGLVDKWRNIGSWCVCCWNRYGSQVILIWKLYNCSLCSVHLNNTFANLGVNASTHFAKDCGVKMTTKGSIVVDKVLVNMSYNTFTLTMVLVTTVLYTDYLMWIDLLQYLKACDDIYVGGDIASFPLKMIGGEHVTIGHWQLSHAHGEILEITCWHFYHCCLKLTICLTNMSRQSSSFEYAWKRWRGPHSAFLLDNATWKEYSLCR
jgi:hypothetical protein